MAINLKTAENVTTHAAGDKAIIERSNALKRLTLGSSVVDPTIAFSSISSATPSLALDNARNFMRLTHAAPTLTVPLQATVAFTDAFLCWGSFQSGGTITIPTGGTINGVDNASVTVGSEAEGVSFTLRRVAVNTWVWTGGTTIDALFSGLSEAEGVDLLEAMSLDSADAGALAQAGIIAELGVGATQFGTAAFIDAVPSGAPTTATQVAGAITLDFSGKAVLETATTAAITAITLSNITAYSEVTWIVRHTTSRDVSWPAGTRIAGGALTVTGTANSTRRYKIYNNNGTYEVEIGAAMPVGA
jgi:hypothetical protein